MNNSAPDLFETSELGDLLVGLVRAVVRAQDELDRHASQLATEYVDLPEGALAMPPLWYTVKNAAIEVEMSATIQDQKMVCRLLNPASVALYGREASAGARVRLVIGPAGVAPIKTESHA